MVRSFIFILVFISTLSSYGQTQSGVFINQQELPTNQVQLLENYYQVKIQKGCYWYDPYCGLWGLANGPAMGFMLPNLQLGGALRSNASGGKTGIFINGRQIDATERHQWQQLVGPIRPDRYILDAYGNVMTESGVYQLNLVQLVTQKAKAGYNNQGVYHDGHGNTFYRNWYTDTGSGSSSDGFYIIGEDWSYSEF